MKLTGDLFAGMLGALVFFVVVLAPVFGAWLSHSSQSRTEADETALFLQRCEEIRAQRAQRLRQDVTEFEGFLDRSHALHIVTSRDFDDFIN